VFPRRLGRRACAVYDGFRRARTVYGSHHYEDSEPGDGTRVLVEHSWPRGVSKADAESDDRLKEVAPSDDLRERFDPDPDRRPEFRSRYRAELDERPERVAELLDYARSGTLTLIYAATDEEYNNAVVLANYPDERLDDGR